MMFSNYLIYKSNSSKSQEIQFTVINKMEKKHKSSYLKSKCLRFQLEKTTIER